MTGGATVSGVLGSTVVGKAASGGATAVASGAAWAGALSGAATSSDRRISDIPLCSDRGSDVCAIISIGC